MDIRKTNKSWGYKINKAISEGGAFIHAALALVIVVIAGTFQNRIMRLQRDRNARTTSGVLARFVTQDQNLPWHVIIWNFEM